MTYDPATGCITYTADRLICKAQDNLAGQYSESTNLRELVRIFVAQLEESECNLADLCVLLDCDNATGEQLTAIGEIVGWPRTHCSAQCTVSFGFACPGTSECDNENILGWCSGEWLCGTQESATKDYTFTDDELYRSFIKAKIAARFATGTTTEVLATAQALLGPDTCLGNVQNGETQIIAPRLLTSEEKSIIELIRRILPVSLAGTATINESDGPPFGFACPGTDCEPAGWCDGAWSREVSSTC